MNFKLFIVLLSTIVLPAASAAQPQTTGSRKTVWTGVYTEAQAARGQFEYEANCANCHRTYNQSINPESKLSGEFFMERWREDNLEGFFDLVKATMPRREPGSLADEVYVDIIAHILQKNNFPPGKEEMTVNGLKGIQVEGQFGPQPLPSGALVQTVGCLTPDGSQWSLARAGEPARTRRSNGSTAPEMELAQARQLGNQTFRLQNIDYVSRNFEPGVTLDTYKGHKAQVKGYLVRQPNRPRIDVTSLEVIGTSCSP